MNRAGLIVLQVLGALSILPYPFILIANIMSLAAPGQTAIGAIPWLLLSVYPLIWLGLDIFAWRAMSRGQVGLAFGLSSIPVAACLAAAALFAFSTFSLNRANDAATNKVRSQMESVNPLLYTIWSTAGDMHFPPSPTIPAEQALKAIEANPSQVNIAVEPYGSPLKVAVSNLAVNSDGTPISDANRSRDTIRVIKALVDRGAHFAPGEVNLYTAWKLKVALHTGPITTSTENPLVWRMLKRTRNGVTPFKLIGDDGPWLNTPTELHGTPLYAALVQDSPDLYPTLINAGARLSPAEANDPVAAAALERVFEHDAELRRTYTKK